MAFFGVRPNPYYWLLSIWLLVSNQACADLWAYGNQELSLEESRL